MFLQLHRLTPLWRKQQRITIQLNSHMQNRWFCAATPTKSTFIHGVPSSPTWSVQEILASRENSRALVGEDVVRSAAALAQLPINEGSIKKLQQDFTGLLHFVEYIQGVDTEGVEPLESVVEHQLELREDVVTEGNCADKVLANAAKVEGKYFVAYKALNSENKE